MSLNINPTNDAVINLPLGYLPHDMEGAKDIQYSEEYIKDGLWCRDWTCTANGIKFSGWEVLGN